MITQRQNPAYRTAHIFTEEQMMEERYELACQRLQEWIEDQKKNKTPIPTHFSDYLMTQATLLDTVIRIYEDPASMATREVNRLLYRDIAGDKYEISYTNPAYSEKYFGKRLGDVLCYIATHIRDTIVAAYEKDLWTVLIYLELFLELQRILSENPEEESPGYIREMIYYFINDYDEERMDKMIRELVVSEDSLIYELVMNRNHADPTYLYEYGEYITENEVRLSEYLSGLSETRLESMARTYTDGYYRGFELAGINLAKKETVEIRFPIGFEPMVKRAVIRFEKMGLKPTFRRVTNTQTTGVISTSPNRQYQYDHRFDDALYLNAAYADKRLSIAKKVFDTYKKNAGTYAGPAVIETFGEKLFVPEKKKQALAYTEEQERIHVGYRSDFSLLQDRYIHGDERSYTIIAYPIPEIGSDFETIFAETARINTLDEDEYRRIQQAIIDVLDEGDHVRILGSGKNRTDLTVKLHELDNPKKETNFENCLADVNIPVGEVFTSPVLKGTNGRLHVSRVYLQGLKYDDLWLDFQDGMVSRYGCSNYSDVESNRAYIRENILNNHDTLPMGEFAIGTNTAAYVMGRRFSIEDKLPILIAEKTGPHFAVGDTCYSMSEEVIIHNPDGKEIIAKDNECSILRKEDPGKAYFQCHTDITIPYEELGSISVFTKEGKETIIIRNGRYVLPGTEVLNDVLDEWDSTGVV